MKNIFWGLAIIVLLIYAWLFYGWIIQGNDNFCSVPKVENVKGL